MIQFPLSLKQSATLQREADPSVLATFKSLNLFGNHQFVIPEYGILASHRLNLSFRKMIDYRNGEQWIGTTEAISATRDIGKLALLPSEIPLSVRIFILMF